MWFAIHGRVSGMFLLMAWYYFQIGGSVRIPAAFNGLWGMRPSMNRIPYEGAANSYMGQHTIYSVIGPLTHSHKGVVTFIKAILEQRPW